MNTSDSHYRSKCTLVPCHLHSYCSGLRMPDRLIHKTQALKNISVLTNNWTHVVLTSMHLFNGLLFVWVFGFGEFFGCFFPSSIISSCKVDLSFLEGSWNDLHGCCPGKKGGVLIWKECLVNTVNLNEITVILQICSRVPQLLVLYELDLRLFLHLFKSHLLLDSRVQFIFRLPIQLLDLYSSGIWGSAIINRLYPYSSLVG